MTDTLQRVFDVCAGGGDAATRAELLRDGSEARRLAEDLDRLNRKQIDLRQIPGLKELIEADGHWGPPRRHATNGTPPGGSALPACTITAPPAKRATRVPCRRKALVAASVALVAIAGIAAGTWGWLRQRVRC